MKEYGQFQNHRSKPREPPFYNVHQEHDPSGQMQRLETHREYLESPISQKLATYIDEVCKENRRIHSQPAPPDIRVIAHDECKDNPEDR